MVRDLFLVLLVGLIASSEADLDAETAAEKILSRLDVVLRNHETEWTDVPGTEIKFHNLRGSKWNVHYARVTSISGAGMSKYGVRPNIIHYSSSSSSIVFDVDVKGFKVEYKFGCKDIFGKSGYTYSISRNITTQVTLIVDVFGCRGSVHSTPGSYRWNDEGKDLSEITPNDGNAKKCIVRSYTKTQDYAEPLGDLLYDHSGPIFDQIMTKATQKALDNLDLCSE